MRWRRIVLLLWASAAALSAAGCGSDAAAPAAGEDGQRMPKADGGAADGGVIDGGVSDRGTVDSDVDAGAATPSIGGLPVAAVVNSWYQRQDEMLLTFVSTSYLLLADGSVRMGLPDGSLKDFDARVDRAEHPARWGRWRLSDGQYAFQFGTGDYDAPPNQSVYGAARADERLSGVWTADASADDPSASSATLAVTFSADGRFEQVGVSRFVGTLPGGGAGSDSATPRRGRYMLSGFTITLVYDDGETIALLFSADSTRRTISIGERELYADG